MDGTVVNNPGTCTCAWACDDANGSDIGIGGGCTGRGSDAAITEGDLLVSRLVFVDDCTMSGDRGLSASFHVGMLRSIQNRSNMDQQHLVPSGWNDAQRTLSSCTYAIVFMDSNTFFAMNNETREILLALTAYKYRRREIGDP